ncbi:MAG: XRE family transcriptional regulator, partial [Chitinophagaceae bacterium]
MKTSTTQALTMIRVDLGISQQQLADSLGLPRSRISMAELGIRPLPQIARDYLHDLLQIARRLPKPASISRKRRPSVATQRPAYNRIAFSRRKAAPGKGHIDTSMPYQSVFSKEESRETAQRLKDRFSYDRSYCPTSADACHELLISLEQKRAVIQCQLDVLELDKAAAPQRAVAVKAKLIERKIKLKSYRQLCRENPALRKRYRSKIARLYLQKIQAEEEMEKFNRPAMT